MSRYTVLLYPEATEGGYSVIVPSLPGCVTQGESVDEALAHAREAIAGYILALEDSGDKIPDEAIPPSIATDRGCDNDAVQRCVLAVLVSIGRHAGDLYRAVHAVEGLSDHHSFPVLV